VCVCVYVCVQISRDTAVYFTNNCKKKKDKTQGERDCRLFKAAYACILKHCRERERELKQYMHLSDRVCVCVCSFVYTYLEMREPPKQCIDCKTEHATAATEHATALQ
jgi:hypothetical protein